MASPNRTSSRARSGATTDGGIGFLNGVLGGLTGLPGFIITVWCQMRGWSKDEQRAVFQPVILTGMMMIAISLSVAGAITTDTLKLYMLGLPALLAGLWLGFKCYGKLDDSTFRKIVLLLLLCSGLALIAAQAIDADALRVGHVRADIACFSRPPLPAYALDRAGRTVGDAASEPGTAMDGHRHGLCIEVRDKGRIFRDWFSARKGKCGPAGISRAIHLDGAIVAGRHRRMGRRSCRARLDR